MRRQNPYPNIPHLRFPFSLPLSGCPVTEQDSADEVFDCVQAIVHCPQGARMDLPDFGIPDLVFSQAPPDPVATEQAIAQWEPRAQVEVTTYPEPSDPSDWHVHIEVAAVE